MERLFVKDISLIELGNTDYSFEETMPLVSLDDYFFFFLPEIKIRN